MSEKIIVLDTETANSLEEPICYDIGWGVFDLDTHELLLSRSFAVAEIFLDKELMSSAYFSEKIPSYWEEIKAKERTLARLSTIYRQLREDVKEFSVKRISAHNARFDNRSCNLTQRYVNASKYRYFFPFGIEIWDTLKMAREVFGKDEEYLRFCEENEYLTKLSKPRFTAEILFRFLSGENDFEEKHRGIDDVLIEKEILFECLKRKPEINGKLWG